MIKDSLLISPKKSLSVAPSNAQEGPSCFVMQYGINLSGQTIVPGGAITMFFQLEGEESTQGLNLYSCSGESNCSPIGSAEGSMMLNKRIGSITVAGYDQMLLCNRLTTPHIGDVQTFIISDINEQVYIGIVHVRYNPERIVPVFSVPDQSLYLTISGAGSIGPPVRLFTMIDGNLDSTQASWDVGNPFHTADSFAVMMPGEWKEIVAKASLPTACGDTLTAFSYLSLYKAPEVHHFAMDVSPRTLDFLDTAVIRLQAYDENGEAMGYPLDAEFTIAADVPGYGHFEHSNIYGGVGRSVEGGRESKKRRLQQLTASADTSVLTFTYGEAIGGGVYFIADGKYPASPKDVHLLLSRSLDGAPLQQDSVSISPLCQTVEVTPSELNPGDTAVVNILMTMKDGSKRPFPAGTAFSFSIQQESDQNNRLLYQGVLDDHFNTVTELPFRFIADTTLNAQTISVIIKGNPVEPVNIMMTKQNKKRKINEKGICEIGKVINIKNYDLSFVNKDELRTMWPYLPDQSDGKSRGSNLLGYQPTISPHISLIDVYGNPVVGKGITIETQFVEGSGGHDHINGDKVLPVEKQGFFYFDGKKKGKNPYPDMKTDANGKVSVDSFSMAQISGKYIIKALLQSDPTVWDTVNIYVAVPELINLYNSVAVYPPLWEFYQASATYKENHKSPYWINKTIVDSILMAAYEWNDWCNENNHKDLAILSFNDMSLENGGSFEFVGKWNISKEHSFHRTGYSIDINGSATYRTATGGLTQLGIDLDRCMKLFGGVYYNEGTVHYGFNKQN